MNNGQWHRDRRTTGPLGEPASNNAQYPEQSAQVEKNHNDNNQEEGETAPLTEFALPSIEQNQLETEREREIRDEEAFRAGEERATRVGEPTGVLSEVAAQPVVERVPTHREPWATLESAESRVASAPLAVKQKKKLSEFATHVYTVSYLVFFAIFGTLARIGLQALTFYPGAPVTTGVLWANVGGCLLMGFFAEDRNIFRDEWGEKQNSREKEKITETPSSVPSSQQQQQEHEKQPPVSREESLRRHKATKKTIPLYIGLTTGFCGCFTSFSTFMVDVFLALSNDLPNPNNDSITSRNGGYSFMAVVAVILYTVSLSLSSLVAGGHLALALDRCTPTIPFTFIRKYLDRTIVILAFGCWLGSVFLALWPPDRHNPVPEQNWRGRAVFAIVFAPIGCLFRFYVSILLNARIPAFPLGTFVVNMVGTLVIAMCFDIQHASRVVAWTGEGAAKTSFSRLISCQVLNGVMDGFCGCATTVSTWIAELHSLELKHAYRYGIVSVGLALAFLVVTIGSMRWTVGLAHPVC